MKICSKKWQKIANTTIKSHQEKMVDGSVSWLITNALDGVCQ